MKQIDGKWLPECEEEEGSVLQWAFAMANLNEAKDYRRRGYESTAVTLEAKAYRMFETSWRVAFESETVMLARQVVTDEDRRLMRDWYTKGLYRCLPTRHIGPI